MEPTPIEPTPEPTAAPSPEPAPDPATVAETSAAPLYTCPNCFQTFDASDSSDPILTCPHCTAQFFRPSVEGDNQDAEDDEAEEQSPEAELSEARIKQLSTLRRTAYRSRSYVIIGTLACLGVALQICAYVYKFVRDAHHWIMAANTWLFCAALALFGAMHFARRTIQIQREINASLRARELEDLEAAKHEPDLSTLSDGSHHARHLEQMTAKKEDEQSEAGEERQG